MIRQSHTVEHASWAVMTVKVRVVHLHVLDGIAVMLESLLANQANDDVCSCSQGHCHQLVQRKILFSRARSGQRTMAYCEKTARAHLIVAPDVMRWRPGKSGAVAFRNVLLGSEHFQVAIGTHIIEATFDLGCNRTAVAVGAHFCCINCGFRGCGFSFGKLGCKQRSIAGGAPVLKAA